MSQPLDGIEYETHPNPDWSVIWMHGLGASSQDFAYSMSELGLSKDLAVRFIFPDAPQIPVTCNNGYIMPAWYDVIRFDDINRHTDEAGIRKSREMIRALITRENERGMPSERIVLAGFSQGGAMAYMTALTHPEGLAGIVALSTYIPAPALLTAEYAEANRNTPIFAAHGTMDPIVPFALGEMAARAFKEAGHAVTWHAYPMAHNVVTPEFQAIGVWLNKLMAGG